MAGESRLELGSWSSVRLGYGGKDRSSNAGRTGVQFYIITVLYTVSSVRMWPVRNAVLENVVKLSKEGHDKAD